jgi:GntR family transcriptional regulator/MocR family aminotransferase
LREQILSQVKQAVVEGVLMPDDPLPSSRSLAEAVGVSRTTVLGCYLELEGDGWIYGAQGAGTFVARRGTVDTPERPPDEAPPPDASVQLTYDFRPGSVDPAILSGTEWRGLLRLGAPSATAAPASGAPELRSALASYLGSARGLQCTPEEIFVCAGTAEAVSLLCTALGWNGRDVAIEDPGYPAIRNVLQRMSVRCVSLDVTQPSAVPETLASLEPLAATYLTPSHQYPLGHRMSRDDRLAVIDWADRAGTVVVEDDYDGEFTFGIAPSTSMAGLRPTSNVVFVGTMSKVLDPGLRLAYLRVPPHLVDQIRRTREDLGSTVATPIQLGVAAFIRSGELSRHIARARRIYSDRRRALLRELAECPWVRDLVGIDAGLHIVALLDPAVNAQRLVEEAWARGVGLASLDEFRSSRAHGEPALVLGYSRHTPAAIRAAMAVVAQCAQLRPTR